MGKIALLSDVLIDQIAAGEVVERPASVVKELCENGLDAGAGVLRIELAEGGLSRISVLDDGSGMSPEDARLSLARHATSKLRDAEGLSRIDTMGFRGEALPSIASVSRFTLTTREASALGATRLRLEGGRLIEEGEVGAPPGTQVVVDDLFFNTPARRKFSKRPTTELGHCVEAVARLALARPDVGFHLAQNGKTSFTSPAHADARERVAAAISPKVFAHLLPVAHRHGALRVTGHVTSPAYNHANRTGLYTFVNRRFIRDRGLVHAIIRAYGSALPPGRQPAAVLFLELPLDAVDVNVHPQKLEVRFLDPRAVQDAVVEAVRAALRESAWMKAAPDPIAQAKLGVAEAIEAYRASRSLSFPSPPEPGAAPRWDSRLELEVPPPRQPDVAPPTGTFSALRHLGELAGTYLVCEGPEGALVLVDRHAAQERLHLDTLRALHAAGPIKGQGFLFPVQLTLAPAEARALLERPAELTALGLELDPFGGDTLALKTVPALAIGCDYARLLTELAKGLASGEGLEGALRTLACHAAGRAGPPLSHEEARRLLDALDGIDLEVPCRHGSPLAAELTLAELESRARGR